MIKRNMLIYPECYERIRGDYCRKFKYKEYIPLRYNSINVKRRKGKHGMLSRIIVMRRWFFYKRIYEIKVLFQSSDFRRHDSETFQRAFHDEETRSAALKPAYIPSLMYMIRAGFGHATCDITGHVTSFRYSKG